MTKATTHIAHARHTMPATRERRLDTVGSDAVRVSRLATVVSTIVLTGVVAAGCSSKTDSTSATDTQAPARTAVDRTAAPAAAAAPGAAGDTATGQLPAGHPGNVFTGAIVESMDSGGYTYAKLKSDTSEIWIAGPQFTPVSGEVVSVALDMPMENFESKTLKRTFPMLYFVADVGRNGQPARSTALAPPALASSHGTDPGAAPSVAKLAPPPGGVSVADLFARKSSLGGSKVTMRGTVVKYNGGILDKNWLHIQDGSGSAEQHTNDITVTTTDVAKVGDVVTVTGVVGLNRDFTAGYSYDVIVENATISR